MTLEVTNERKAYREEMKELSLMALDLAAKRCELALVAGDLYMKSAEIGKEMERLGAEELKVHKKRKELASLLLKAPVEPGMDVV